jgi:hypothetical protein
MRYALFEFLLAAVISACAIGWVALRRKPDEDAVDADDDE